MDNSELLMAMERALEARRSLKEFFKSMSSNSRNSTRTKSHEAALLVKVEQTRNEFEIILGKYVDERIKSALHKSKEVVAQK